MTTVNEAVRNNTIRAHIDVQRYGQSVVLDVQKLLTAADIDLLNQLIARIDAGKEGTWTTNRLTKVLNDLSAINETTYGKAADLMQGVRQDIAQHTAETTLTSLQTAIPAEVASMISFTMPTTAQLVAMVNTAPIRVGDNGALLLEEIFKTLSSGKIDLIRQEVRMGMVEGESIQSIVKRLIGTKSSGYSDGVLSAPRRHATNMVRTIVNSTSNQAADLVYKENQDLIKMLRWVSTLDGRTSPICRARDGLQFPINSGPRPPAHVSCRSFMIAVIKGWKEMGLKDPPEGTRSSLNGEVPGNMTYQEWLRTQPVASQRDILGPTRYEMFKKGTPLDKFVADGRALTLEEIRARQ